jgi:hypothetical protein
LCKSQRAPLERVVNGQLNICILKTGHGLRYVSENNPIALERRAKLSPMSPMGKIFPANGVMTGVEAADLKPASTLVTGLVRTELL